MSRNPRGFTLVELVIVTSILTVLTPLVLMTWRLHETREFEQSALLAFATSARTVSEELRRDLHAGKPGAGLSFAGESTCGAITYLRESDGTLVRKTASCGQRFVARDVDAIDVKPGRVTLSFARRTSATAAARTTFTIGLPGVTP